MASGATFADTVWAMRMKSGVNVGELGAPIKTMRRTRDGNLLLEFGGGAKAEAAAAKLKSLLVSSISEDVGQIVNLESLIDIEIVDIDAIASREEVEEALNKVVGAKLGAAKDKVLEDIKLTGLWSIRSGQQIVTARVSKSVVNSLDRVPVGWTMCRVRPRAPQPLQCYRCHGFSHTSGDCKGPDITVACRRCGVAGPGEGFRC